MKQDRLNKFQSVALKLLSEIIFEEIEDCEKNFWIITITKIKISSDLSYLDVYISSFKQKEILPHTLAKHGFDIQKKFNKKIWLMKLPKIRFRYDDSWENFSHIDELLKEIKVDENTKIKN